MAAADLIVTGSVIRTADRRKPVVEAFAVRDGRILDVGTTLTMQAHRRPDTRMLDVGDAAVYPGFVDVHNHHAMAGRTELFELSLPPPLALDDILDLVRDRAHEVWASSSEPRTIGRTS